MEKLADLHMHTFFSDGTFSSEKTVQEAIRQGLSCIAITDHDTIDGVKPALEAAKGTALEIITGVELSTDLNGHDIHMLAYGFDLDDTSFTTLLNEWQSERRPRMQKMIEKLKEMGMKDLHLDEVSALAKSKSVGRMHLATILAQKGYVKDNQEAFDKYIGTGKPAYVGRKQVTPFEVIAAIDRAGGAAVLAHPMLTKVDELIPEMARQGLKGLEVFYPNTADHLANFYKKLAEKYNLIVTGGSDAHGAAKKNTYLGKVKIPYEYVEQLKGAMKRGR